MVREDLTPCAFSHERLSRTHRRELGHWRFHNCLPHIVAIARHTGVPLETKDWETIGTIFHCSPTSSRPANSSAKDTSRRGVPAIFGELICAGKIHTGAHRHRQTVGENYQGAKTLDANIIRPFDKPLMEKAGFLVVSGNLFESALMKPRSSARTSAAASSPRPDRRIAHGPRHRLRGPRDYRATINDPALHIDEHCILVVRGCGPSAIQARPR
jgi:dihydroxy-acid dehydratase